MNKLSLFVYFCLFFAINGCKKTNKADISYEARVEQKIKSLEKANTGVIIENQSVYFGKDSLKTTKINNLTSKCFFFYFSINTCTPCIDNAIECIKMVFPDYLSNDDIIFISPDYPDRLKDNCYGKKLLTLSTGKIGIPLEKEKVPFIFTLTEQLSIDKIHIVNKNDFTKTVEFLKLIH